MTVKVAVAEPVLLLFCPVSLVEIKPLMLVLGPVTDVVTSTWTVQLLLVGIVPPEKFNMFVPIAGDQMPPQGELAFGGLATVMPVGRVSVKLALVNAIELGLLKVKVSVDTPLAAITLGANALVRVGC